MSKIGKQPIKIPKSVTVSIDDDGVLVKGPKGEIRVPLLNGVKVVMEEDVLNISITSKTKQTKSNWGTERALIQNAVTGTESEFEKKLILEGVGYRVVKEGENLSLNLGFSHPVKYIAPKGITFDVEKNSILKIKGIDKGLVGKVAADIRHMKEPEPYKGKGFRYENEVIRRKAGKKAAGSTSSS